MQSKSALAPGLRWAEKITSMPRRVREVFADLRSSGNFSKQAPKYFLPGLLSKHSQDGLYTWHKDNNQHRKVTSTPLVTAQDGLLLVRILQHRRLFRAAASLVK